MAKFDRFDGSTWERLYEFVLPSVESLKMDEVGKDLAKEGIDLRRARANLQETLKAAQAREALRKARDRRPSVEFELRSVAPAEMLTRDEVRRRLETKFKGPALAAHFRNLESANDEDDLRSLLEDAELLDHLPEERPNGS